MKKVLYVNVLLLVACVFLGAISLVYHEWTIFVYGSVILFALKCMILDYWRKAYKYENYLKSTRFIVNILLGIILCYIWTRPEFVSIVLKYPLIVYGLIIICMIYADYRVVNKQKS